MFDAWLTAFEFCTKDGGPYPGVKQLAPALDFICVFTRNTTTCERTLESVKTQLNRKGQELSLQQQNDALVVKQFVAKDEALMHDSNGCFDEVVHLRMNTFGGPILCE